MSTQFEPKEILGKGTESYDSYAYAMIKYLEEKDEGFALACEVKMDKLDEEWAKQGEP